MEPLATYLSELGTNLKSWGATEHTHRPAAKKLLESVDADIIATNEPRRTDVGAPDFLISRRGLPVGYVETKDLTKDLAREHTSEQLKRYRNAFSNLLLTNYLSFRLYRDGELVDQATLAEDIGDGSIRHLSPSRVEEVSHLLKRFLSFPEAGAQTAEELAERMAAKAREIARLITATFKAEGSRGQLHTRLEAFRRTLLPDLTQQGFADMYAQTLAYGLFSARASSSDPQEFSRISAAYALPETNPFLRALFSELAGPSLDSRISWIVDDLAEVLRLSRFDRILAFFGSGTHRQDPSLQFYETFLAKYAPTERERRGVYYTPDPVVSYITQSTDRLLKEQFGRDPGLADPNTLILDPATGTGTFLHHTVRRIREHLEDAGVGGAWKSYTKEELLPRIYGFELLMAPYTIAHMKLSVLLGNLGYDLSQGERLGVYLTNTLEEGIYSRQRLPFAEYIVEESDAAAQIKRDKPIEVIIGNPPYSGHSANTGRWIKSLIGDYKQVDGQPLAEKNPKWLNDDYVKFIRFGQWRIDKTGQGILAFVTNHGYLDNPTFRGMRHSLMETFTDIYVLDLHGNSKKKEVTPEGGKDENVFDIQQGVAIGIFVKQPGKQKPASVYHADLWGPQQAKYERLLEQDVGETQWTELAPASPSYLFTPQDVELQDEYEQGWKITEVMPVYSPGVVTGRDRDTIRFHREQAEALAAHYGISKDRVQQILYRPFDLRSIVYDPKVITRTRYEVMRHMLPGGNFALLWTRPMSPSYEFGALVSRSIVDQCVAGNKSAGAGISYLAPLYLFSEQDTLDATETTRRPNLSQEFTSEVSRTLKLQFAPEGEGDLKITFGPEDVLHYAYAIFNSPSYESRYDDFLKRDFPRLPLTSNFALFAELVKLGKELVAGQTMRGYGAIAFPNEGSNIVDRVRYLPPGDGDTGRVYINQKQYFQGVSTESWEFQVAGYQPLLKWLKDRRGCALAFSDIQHYQLMATGIGETERIRGEIDKQVKGWPLK